VPPPRPTTLETLAHLPSVYQLPFETWNPETGVTEKGIEDVPLAVHECERAAQRELISILRLIDSGKVVVSDKTRRPSGATLNTIKAVLNGGDDFYPYSIPEDKWSDENAGPTGLSHGLF
jgi:hypothetical protein